MCRSLMAASRIFDSGISLSAPFAVAFSWKTKAQKHRISWDSWHSDLKFWALFFQNIADIQTWHQHTVTILLIGASEMTYRPMVSDGALNSTRSSQVVHEKVAVHVSYGTKSVTTSEWFEAIENVVRIGKLVEVCSSKRRVSIFIVFSPQLSCFCKL